MRKILKTILLILIFMGAQKILAQNPNNAILYSNQATLFGQQSSSGDPVSVVLPGTAFKSGFGSFVDNPASMALHNESFFEFGLSHRNVEENSRFLGESRIGDKRDMGLNNLGFLYSYPTERGSFVIGAGYSEQKTFNRALEFRGRNETSSITDAFKADGSQYQNIAFNTFATDYGDSFQDWDESILRVGFDRFGDFLGITQQGSITESGVSGEYSLFFATEFQEDLFIGVSAGIISGNYSYDRIFQEDDELNLYDSTIIDSNSDGTGETDVDRIFMDEQLESTFNGFRGRAGLMYKVSEQLNIGASYTLPTVINVDEIYDVTLNNRFDNGEEFEDLIESEFSYDIRHPSVISVGVGVNDISGLSLSFAADYTDYSNTSIDFIDNELIEDELAENDFIEQNFESVWNLRAGASFNFSKDFSLRAGAGYNPSRFVDGIDDRTILSGGAGFTITDNIRLELTAVYTNWEEDSSVYDYVSYDYSPLPDDRPTNRFRSAEANRSVDKWQMMGTLRFRM